MKAVFRSMVRRDYARRQLAEVEQSLVHLRWVADAIATYPRMTRILGPAHQEIEATRFRLQVAESIFRPRRARSDFGKRRKA